MNGIKQKHIILVLCAAFVFAALLSIRFCAYAQTNAPEIALTIGEPWEDMRKRSSAEISPAIPDEIWFRTPLSSNSRLRFIDPQYGFVTPPAKFFTIGFTRGVIDGVRMSPQIEPLLLDDALKVVLDIEKQLQKKGWKQILVNDWPLIEDTPKWRAQLRDPNGNGHVTYWHANDKFQVLLGLRRFADDKHPDEERYLIDLNLARPWTEP